MLSTAELLMGYKPQQPREIPKKRTRLPEAAKKHYPTIRKMLKEKADNTSIAIAIGCNKRAITRYIQSHPTLRQLSSERNRVRKPFTPHRNRVKELLLARCTLREMSEEIPFVPSAIYERILRDDELSGIAKKLWRTK